MTEHPAPGPGLTSTVLIGFPLALTCLWLLVAPNFDLVGFAHVYDEKRIGQLVVLTATALWLIAAPGRLTAWLDMFRRLPAAARVVLAVVLAGGLASSVLAADPRSGLLEVSHLTLLFFLALAIATTFRDLGTRADRFAAAAITAGAALFLVDFAVRYWASLSLGAGTPPLPTEAFPSFAHLRFFGQWQTWTLPLVGLLRFYLPPAARPLRWLVDSVVVVWWALLFLSGTRGTLLAQVVALSSVAVLFGVHGQRSGRRWLALQLRLAAAGLVLYVIGYLGMVSDWSAFFAMFDHVSSMSGHGRRELWTVAIATIGSHPWLGIGPQHYQFLDAPRAAHPHNAILQWAAEWGLPSALLMVGVTITALRAWLVTSRAIVERTEPSKALVAAMPMALPIGLTASLVAGLTHAMVSGLIVMPMSQTLFALTAGWAIGVAVRDTSGLFVEPSGRRRPRLPLAAALAIVSVVMLVSAWPATGKAWFAHQPGPDGESERFQPRFWRRNSSLSPTQPGSEPAAAEPTQAG